MKNKIPYSVILIIYFILFTVACSQSNPSGPEANTDLYIESVTAFKKSSTLYDSFGNPLFTYSNVYEFHIIVRDNYHNFIDFPISISNTRNEDDINSKHYSHTSYFYSVNTNEYVYTDMFNKNVNYVKFYVSPTNTKSGSNNDMIKETNYKNNFYLLRLDK